MELKAAEMIAVRRRELVFELAILSFVGEGAKCVVSYIAHILRFFEQRFSGLGADRGSGIWMGRLAESPKSVYGSRMGDG